MIRRGLRHSSRGFTLIELLVVIAIMGILLVLGVVNLRSTQVTARDSQRASDVQTIATALEAFYPIGNSTVTPGDYPSTAMVSNPQTYLIDINPKALIAPSQTTQSLVAATNAVQTTAGVTPQPTISQYVYQPITIDGSGNITLCTADVQNCRSYNLYYQTEADNVIHIITSRHK